MITLRTALINFSNWVKKSGVVVDGVITSVDTTKFTCSVTVSGVGYSNVPLKVLVGSQASFIEIPKVKSKCLMGFRDMNILRPQLISVHQIDKLLVKINDSTAEMEINNGKIIFNGGNLGGIPKIQELTDNINSIKNFVTALNNALPAAFTAIGASTAAAGANGATSIQTAMSSQSITIKDMEDKNVTH
jgi:hypothetical protein